MSYPLIIAANGEVLARTNADCTWSVQWNRVLDIAYSKPTVRQRAVVAYAKLLLAARDNFFLTPWEQGLPWDREHFEAVIDYVEQDPEPGVWQTSIVIQDETIAYVNYEGMWSVDWDSVLEIARMPIEGHMGMVALIGICRILQAAKDRFLTLPWDDGFDEE